MTRAAGQWPIGAAVLGWTGAGVALSLGGDAWWPRDLGLVLIAAAALAATAFGLRLVSRSRPRRIRERPPRLATFRGRDWELGQLRRRFDDLRQPGASNGAI